MSFPIKDIKDIKCIDETTGLTHKYRLDKLENLCEFIVKKKYENNLGVLAEYDMFCSVQNCTIHDNATILTTKDKFTIYNMTIVDIIKQYLCACEMAIGKDAKKVFVARIYKVFIENIMFIKNHRKFADVFLKKCFELKNDAPDVINKFNEFIEPAILINTENKEFSEEEEIEIKEISKSKITINESTKVDTSKSYRIMII